MGDMNILCPNIIQVWCFQLENYEKRCIFKWSFSQKSRKRRIPSCYAQHQVLWTITMWVMFSPVKLVWPAIDCSDSPIKYVDVTTWLDSLTMLQSFHLINGCIPACFQCWSSWPKMALNFYPSTRSECPSTVKVVILESALEYNSCWR